MCSYEYGDLVLFSDDEEPESSDSDDTVFSLTIDPESIPRSPAPEPEPDWDEFIRALAE